MMQREASGPHTVEQYLELERATEEKLELIDGKIHNLSEALATSGDMAHHSLITVNVGSEIGNRMKGTPCRVYGSGLRIGIPGRRFFAYPDVSVICGKPELDADASAGHTATNPKTLVEVLSPSTEAYDRGEKFARYREISSLEEYVLVSQDTPRIEVFFRQADGSWAFTVFTEIDAVARFRSVQIELPLAEAYAGVTFPAESS